MLAGVGERGASAPRGRLAVGNREAASGKPGCSVAPGVLGGGALDRRGCAGLNDGERFRTNHRRTTNMQTPRTIQWIGDTEGFVRLIDQTLLPSALQYKDCRTVEEVWEAIRSLRVRGAPAIGIAAAMGVVVGLQGHTASSRDAFLARLDEVCDYLRTSRPTAVNLFWALDRVQPRARELAARPPKEILDALQREALAIEEEDRRMCRAIGAVGAALIQDGSGVLTHCNAG